LTRGLRIREALAALVVYLSLAYLLTASTWRDPTNRWIGSCCDQEQSIWFLAWLPTALESAQNPLLTDRLNAPDGANLMWNTSSSVVALAVAPVTRTLGPILAYNIAVVGLIALSGLACYFALRRYTERSLGPLVGGGLYAISPYIASHTALHLSLVGAWSPPLFLILLDEIVVRRRRRPELLGVGLGVVGALQLLAFEEVLATSAVAAVVLLAVLALLVRDRAQIIEAGSRLLRAGVPGLLAFLLLAGGPLAVQFFGPQRISGRIQDTAAFSTDLLNLVIPTPYQLLAPDAVTALSSQFSGLFHEATAYVGVPLLIVIAWLVVMRGDDLRVRVAGIVAAAMFVLSLGPELTVGASSWGVPLPWLPIGNLPLLEHVVPGRLTLYMWLAVAGLVAFAVDHVTAQTRRRAAVRLALIAAALVFVLPAPARSSTTAVPPFFRSWASQGIGADETILFAPWFTNGAGADPMLWAAVAEARPRILEGYVYVPGDEGRPGYGPPAGPIGRLMIEVQDNGTSRVPTGSTRAAALRDLADRAISVVIVGPMRYRAEMVSLFTNLLGQPPEQVDGVQLWRDVPRLVSQTSSPGG
jgi:hypothetical protein